MIVDTSSAPAADSSVVTAAAALFAWPSVEPMPAKSVAAATSASGAATTKDIANLHNLPSRGEASQVHDAHAGYTADTAPPRVPVPRVPSSLDGSRPRRVLMQGFAGKVAAVTGAGSGIGQALAIELARSGAKVAISDVDT